MALSTSSQSAVNEAQGTLQPAAWMKNILLAAAVYNLLWGAIAILTPELIFRLAGFDPMPLYPELWQCIGMIVGVYGVGYAIAAYDPYRHWPIVLVGLLGKIFGPIGFLNAVLQDRLPASMGWTIVTNDLIWWIPFSLILWRAAQAAQCSSQLLAVAPPKRPLDPLSRVFSQYGSSLTELSREKPLLVVFLRHSGCTFCREALADIAGRRAEIEANGTAIALVHMGHVEPNDLLEQHDLSDLHCFRDPSCALYEAFGLKLGSPLQLFGPFVWWRGLLAFARGHRIGALNGNGFRMPGVFLLFRNEVVRSYRHANAADRPDYLKLSKLPEGSEPQPVTGQAVLTHA